jgi:Nucleotidyl transferase AbiEii toxin, Type IV TA system
MNGITDAQRAALTSLAPALEADTYLAGGVAAALSLHHRTSVDLDLFVPYDFDQERLAERIAATVSGARIVGRGRGTLHLEVGGVPTSILAYRYPSLAPAVPHPDLAFPVASADDLVCMKLSAIAGRGAAKDFWDLDALLASGAAGGSLEHALELFGRKYASEDVGHVVRSLAYFGEADAALLPLGLTQGTWEAVKRRMLDRVRGL